MTAHLTHYIVIRECRPDLVHDGSIHGELHLFPGDIIERSTTNPSLFYITVAATNEQLPWWIRHALKEKKIEPTAQRLPAHSSRPCPQCIKP